MAPRKKAGKGPGKGAAKRGKLDAFLREFDEEVKARIEQVKVAGEKLVKETEDMCNVEILRIPATLRDMNWQSYFAVGGNKQALDRAVSTDEDIVEITKLASEAFQTSVKIVKKAKKHKKDIETISEDTEATVLPAGKRSRQEEAVGGASEPGSVAHLEKAKASTKKPPTSKKSKPPPTRSTRFSKRLSRTNSITPGTQKTESGSLKFSTPALVPRFDSRVFQTPGLRPPGVQERVFSVSANGSPLASVSDIFITVPVGRGESIHMAASELSKTTLMRLNPQVLGSVKKLSSQLVQLCSTLNSQR